MNAVADFRLRIAFSEQGRARFLSHLEMQRALLRTIRRAQLPYAVTQGFSPHMKLSSGPALPVGVASVREYLDVELTTFVKQKDALARLQAASAPLLPVQAVGYVNPKASSLTALLNVQTLRVVFPPVTDSTEDQIVRVFEALRLQPSFELERKGKRKTYVPAEFVREPARITHDGAGRILLDFSMRMRAEGSLRSDSFVEAFLTQLGLNLADVELIRTGLFFEDGQGQFHDPLSN